MLGYNRRGDHYWPKWNKRIVNNNDNSEIEEAEIEESRARYRKSQEDTKKEVK